MNHRILSTTLLLSLFVLLAPVASSAQSQWTEEGLLLSNEYARYTFVEPDNDGGVWILYDNYNLDILNYRPKLQHFDPDGNKLLGPEGMFVCADTMIAGWSLGLTCLPDNGVAVAYSWFRFDQDPSTSEIYGQRISATGERLLDSNGVQLTFTNAEMYKGNSDYVSSVCGDGSDGMWVTCRKAYSQNRYVVGMTGDGSLKCDLQFIASSVPGTGLIQEDGAGGAYFFYHDTSGIGSVDLYFDHISELGALAYGEENQRPVFGDLHENFLILSAQTTSDNGVIVRVSDDDGFLYIQKISSDLSLPWGTDGYSVYGYQSRYAWTSVLIDDESYFAAIDGNIYGNKVRIGKLSADGVELAGFIDNVLEENDPDIYGYWPLLTKARFNGQEYPVVIIKRDHDPDFNVFDYYYTFHRISADGKTDLWADDPPLLNGHSGYVYDGQYACSLSDGTILLDLRFRESLKAESISSRHHLYKITADGHLASVREAGHPAQLPSQPEILSAWPNPFNASVTITYSLPANSSATLMIFDLTGREVMRTRLSSSSGAGEYVWRPDVGLASGVYFARLISPGNSILRKLMLLR